MNIMHKETEDTNNEISISKNTTCEIKHSQNELTVDLILEKNISELEEASIETA